MADTLVSFFQNMNISDEVIVFLVSMIPVIELRGAVPLGVIMDMNPWILFSLAVLGNMLPVPFIILLARPIVNFFLHTKLFRPLGEWMKNKVEKNSEKVLRYEVWGLFLFVAIPLPGTGAWTGSLIAALLDLRLKKALPTILLGVIVAGLIMIFGSSIVDFIISAFI